MLINCQGHSAKRARKIIRYNFAKKIKIKQTEGIHTNFACKKSQSIKIQSRNNAFQQKMRDILNFQNRVLIIMFFETIAFFRFN